MDLPATAALAMVPIAGAASAGDGRPTAPRVAPETVRERVPPLADRADGGRFADLWLRPEIAPCERSHVKAAALIAEGASGSLPFHPVRMMDAGLTREEVSGAVTPLAFFAGAMIASTTAEQGIRVPKARENAASPGAEAYVTGEVGVASHLATEELARVGGGAASLRPPR